MTALLEGSRENRDPDWEGSNVGNRKHDPAVLRLYLASVAMCWECTLQTHALTHTHTSHFSRPFDSCEHLVFFVVNNWWTCGGPFHRCVRPQSSTAASELFPRFPCSSCFPGVIVDSKLARVVRRQQWETCMSWCIYRHLVLSSGPGSSLRSPHLKTPLLAAGELSTSAAHCVISSETGKINK